MSPDELGDKLGISRAFIRLVLQSGCPTVGGQISEFTFFEWLADHYELVRATAGLSPLPPISEADALWRVSERRKRGFLTVLEFMESRACLRCTRDGARQVLDLFRGARLNGDEIDVDDGSPGEEGKD
jgi:hypothetical protein